MRISLGVEQSIDIANKSQGEAGPPSLPSRLMLFGICGFLRFQCPLESNFGASHVSHLEQLARNSSELENVSQRVRGAGEADVLAGLLATVKDLASDRLAEAILERAGSDNRNPVK
jgi:hypothetical protein